MTQLLRQIRWQVNLQWNRIVNNRVKSNNIKTNVGNTLKIQEHLGESCLGSYPRIIVCMHVSTLHMLSHNTHTQQSKLNTKWPYMRLVGQRLSVCGQITKMWHWRRCSVGGTWKVSHCDLRIHTPFQKTCENMMFPCLCFTMFDKWRSFCGKSDDKSICNEIGLSTIV